MVEVLEASNKAFLEKGGKWWKICTIPRRSLLKALNIIKVFLLMTGKKQFLKKSTQESFLRRRKKRVNTRLLLLKNMFSTFYVDGKYYNLMIYLLRGKASFFFLVESLSFFRFYCSRKSLSFFVVWFCHFHQWIENVSLFYPTHILTLLYDIRSKLTVQSIAAAVLQ